MQSLKSIWRSIILGVNILIIVFGFCGFFSVQFSDIETAILKKNFLEAQSLAEKYIQQYPEDKHIDKVYYYLGLSHLNLKGYAAARETFTHLIEKKANKNLRDKAHLGVIDSFYLDEDYSQALMAAEKFIRKNPKTELASLVYLKIARSHLKLTNWSQSRIYLRKIISNYPASLEAHFAKQFLEEKQYFSVQVGAFLNRDRAEKLAQELLQKGEYAYIIETIDRDQQTFFRVRVGQFSQLKNAKNLKKKLSKLGYPARIYP